MGIDIGAMWEEAKKSASQGMTDMLNQGANAGLGYLEQQAINTIQADKTQHEEAVKQATAKMLSQPSNPNSFGSYFSNLAQGPVVKQYGPYILGAVGIVVVATLMLRK